MSCCYTAHLTYSEVHQSRNTRLHCHYHLLALDTVVAVVVAVAVVAASLFVPFSFGKD